MNYRCEQCKKPLGPNFIWMELNSLTAQWFTPGECPPEESQGLFRLGRDCAKRVKSSNGGEG